MALFKALRCALLLGVVLHVSAEKAAGEAPTDAADIKTETPTDAPKEAATEAPKKKGCEKEDAQEVALSSAEVLLKDLQKELERSKWQWVNAIVAAVIGIAALIDGRNLTKYLVIFSVGAVVFYGVLSQTHWDPWSGEGKYLRYVLALECGLFAAFCTQRGYGSSTTGVQPSPRSGNTECLLGLLLGLYLFHLVKWLPFIGGFSGEPWFVCLVGTIAVAAGCWAMFENLGAGKVLGLMMPLIGSSFLIAAIGHGTMLACSTISPLGAKLATPVPFDKVAPVISFWLMIVSPWSQEEVGVISFLGDDMTVGTTKIQLDKVLGIFFMLVFGLLSARLQLKKDGRLRSERKISVKERNLVPADQTPSAPLLGTASA